MNQNARRGLLAGGNFVTDYVKIIDTWPQQDELASIRSQSMSSGGGPYNVLKNLAALKVGFPLEGVGLVGDDANGQWIRRDCDDHGIDTTQLRTTCDAATSYTDAMCVESDGRRTFFHQRGANSQFSAGHVSRLGSWNSTQHSYSSRLIQGVVLCLCHRGGIRLLGSPGRTCSTTACRTLS